MRWRRATHEDRVDFVGQEDAAVQFDDGALGHGAERGVVEDGVAKAPFGVAHNRVNAGDEWQFACAGVMEPTRLGTNTGMQAGGDHLDDNLAGLLGDAIGVILVAGRMVEAPDDGGFHGRSLSVSRCYLGRLAKRGTTPAAVSPRCLHSSKVVLPPIIDVITTYIQERSRAWPRLRQQRIQ